MISSTQRKELERIKPPKYRERVRQYLAQNGHCFSIETIQKVYSGKRNNIIITEAIYEVFSRYKKEADNITSKINTIIADTPKDIS
ncbi:hypothetical protein SAMN04489761_4428 [Tenacibaculum sp. MAR_2009_124]|uniref:hypothetical protein n=1 Tax=Tenacibaculum sp. MAR_2009_124 TaxID=1250059 RepID=UPI000895DA5F|nr:hypothetical protein [Tenacibaculum sp. MAR_2009_124]SED14855.1 hypothetical protein SAMN04489761_4428 [Tenacibaculum sp. MAR_2009_124]